MSRMLAQMREAWSRAVCIFFPSKYLNEPFSEGKVGDEFRLINIALSTKEGFAASRKGGAPSQKKAVHANGRKRRSADGKRNVSAWN